MITNLDALAQALHKAGLRFGEGRHKRTGYTRKPLGARRTERRRKNKVAKQARKRNR